MDRRGPRAWARRHLRQTPRLYRGVNRAVMVANYSRRRPHEPEFLWFRRLTNPGLFLDVGANVGQSALSYRSVNRTHSILSIEANPHLEPDLRFIKRILRCFDYRMAALADKPGEVLLRVPIIGRTPATQAATLDPAMLDRRRSVIERRADGSFTVAEVRVPAITVDGLTVDPVAMKIDVEGYEEPALRGAEETIVRCRPAILVEATHGATAVRRRLEEHGYRLFAVRDTTLRPFRPGDGSQNVLALHRDDPNNPAVS